MVVWTVVLCIACVVSGHVISQLDYTNEIQEDTDELKVIRDVIKVDFGGDVDERHGAPRADSKDMLYPILIGVAAKIVSTIPLFLTSLALVAGYSLATSKAALLLGGIDVVYHYISEGSFLSPVAKHWKHLPDWGAAMLSHYGYHPPLHGYPGLGYHRDRNDRNSDIQLTD